MRRSGRGDSARRGLSLCGKAGWAAGTARGGPRPLGLAAAAASPAGGAAGRPQAPPPRRPAAALPRALPAQPAAASHAAGRVGRRLRRPRTGSCALFSSSPMATSPSLPSSSNTRSRPGPGKPSFLSFPFHPVLPAVYSRLAWQFVPRSPCSCCGCNRQYRLRSHGYAAARKSCEPTHGPRQDTSPFIPASRGRHKNLWFSFLRCSFTEGFNEYIAILKSQSFIPLGTSLNFFGKRFCCFILMR